MIIHTIPVPHGWSPEQAWEAVSRGDTLTDPEPLWANVETNHGRFARVLDAASNPESAHDNAHGAPDAC